MMLSVPYHPPLPVQAHRDSFLGQSPGFGIPRSATTPPKGRCAVRSVLCFPPGVIVLSKITTIHVTDRRRREGKQSDKSRDGMQTTPVATTSDKSGVRVGQVRDESPQVSQILVANPGRPNDICSILIGRILFHSNRAHFVPF